jgi:hypothetical protein
MNNPAVQAVLLLLAVAILVGNTMIAIAYMKSRRGNSGFFRGQDDKAMDDLHDQVQKLHEKDLEDRNPKGGHVDGESLQH